MCEIGLFRGQEVCGIEAGYESTTTSTKEMWRIYGYEQQYVFLMPHLSLTVRDTLARSSDKDNMALEMTDYSKLNHEWLTRAS